MSLSATWALLRGRDSRDLPAGRRPIRLIRLPLVILIPVPLTLIGIVLGHWLLSAPFTATSMIGFIALAGIIVRNSILLVDFIRRRRARGGAASSAARSWRHPFQAHLLDGRRGDDRRRFHHGRPDFPGPRHLIGLRSRLIYRTYVLVIPAVYVWLRDDYSGMDEI